VVGVCKVLECVGYVAYLVARSAIVSLRYILAPLSPRSANVSLRYRLTLLMSRSAIVSLRYRLAPLSSRSATCLPRYRLAPLLSRSAIASVRCRLARLLRRNLEQKRWTFPTFKFTVYNTTCTFMTPIIERDIFCSFSVDWQDFCTDPAMCKGDLHFFGANHVHSSLLPGSETFLSFLRDALEVRGADSNEGIEFILLCRSYYPKISETPTAMVRMRILLVKFVIDALTSQN